MYIQPCCINQELPPIARQPFSFFQSNGDWTVDKLMASVSQLVENAVCVMVIPEVNVFLLRTLNTYLAKDWYKSIILLTTSNQAEMVRAEFGSNISRVLYAHHKQVADGQFALTNFKHYLVIQGPLLLENDFTLCSYSSSYGNSNDSNGERAKQTVSSFKAAFDAVIPRLRMHTDIASDNELIQKLINLDF